MKKLLDWKQSGRRKPLILSGIRKVGKTWLLKEFGKRHYPNVAYFNFDENEDFKQFFDSRACAQGARIGSRRSRLSVLRPGATGPKRKPLRVKS